MQVSAHKKQTWPYLFSSKQIFHPINQLIIQSCTMCFANNWYLTRRKSRGAVNVTLNLCFLIVPMLNVWLAKDLDRVTIEQ